MKSMISDRSRGDPPRLQYARMCARRVLIVVMVCAVGPRATAADRAMPAATAAVADSAITSGRQRFEKSCAICHGLDARGNGPFADLLNVKPPNLTLLSRAQGGDFPFSRVYRRIDGRDLPLAHGTSAMPIWGARLKREGGDETYVRGRMFEIMLYIESLQQF